MLLALLKKVQKITKINKIIINGNKSLFVDDIREIIKSKTKSIRNIFANLRSLLTFTSVISKRTVGNFIR